MLPRVFTTIDGEAVGASDWSANTSANLGHDQFRARISAAQARRVDVVQGSVVTAWTEYGFPLWEGRVSASPAPEQDGTAVIAAQGGGYAAVKFAQRFPLVVSNPAAWQDASKFPLNRTSSVIVQLQVGPVVNFAEGALGFSVMSGSGNAVAVAIWAPGVFFRRFTGTLGGATYDSRFVTVYSADGPNIAGSLRPEFTDGTGQTVDVTLTSPGDCVVLEFTRATPAIAGAGSNFTIVTDPVLYATAAKPLVYSEDAARTIGDRLGFDTSTIGHPGVAALSSFDWAGGAASALDELAGVDDLRWRVLEDRGDGPVLEFGPYERIWNVSGRTGARWDLAPLERYNRAVIQWSTQKGQLGQFEFQADPDPLQASGLVNELQVNLSNQQTSTDLPHQAAYRALRAGLAERWRGMISTARAFEEGTGREATYEVRAGDLVRITDHSNGALLLRIADVQYGPTGITIGVEAPAIAFGALESLGATRVDRPPAAIAPLADAGEAYLPPGAPRGAPGYGGYGVGAIAPPPSRWGR